MISLCPHTDDDEIPEELLLGKHQLSELGHDSAKIKAMGIFNKVKGACLCPFLMLSCCKDQSAHSPVSSLIHSFHLTNW